MLVCVGSEQYRTGYGASGALFSTVQFSEQSIDMFARFVTLQDIAKQTKTAALSVHADEENDPISSNLI